MANPLAQTIEQVSREKGIEPRLIQEALEDAMVAAARRFFKTEEDLQSRYDPESGTIEVFAVKRIVEEVENNETEMGLPEALREEGLLGAAAAASLPDIEGRALMSAA